MDVQRLHVAAFPARLVNRIAADGHAEMPEVDANLVGAARQRTRFEQGRAVCVATEDAEFRARMQTFIVIHFPCSQPARLGADRRVAGKGFLGGLALHAH